MALDFLIRDVKVVDGTSAPWFRAHVGIEGDEVRVIRNPSVNPKAIREYWRKRRLLTLEQVVHKMTGVTAARLGLEDRGLIKDGFKADIVIWLFDDFGQRGLDKMKPKM